jgi:hypothetical protein
MFKLKKIGVMSMAKLYGVLMAIFGLLVGLFYAGLGLMISNIPAEAKDAAGLTGGAEIMFGPWAILIMPLLYGIIGFFSGLIGAWVYNIVAKRIGGLELELVK